MWVKQGIGGVCVCVNCGLLSREQREREKGENGFFLLKQATSFCLMGDAQFSSGTKGGGEKTSKKRNLS